MHRRNADLATAITCTTKQLARTSRLSARLRRRLKGLIDEARARTTDRPAGAPLRREWLTCEVRVQGVAAETVAVEQMAGGHEAIDSG